MMGISLFGTCTMKYNPRRQRGDRRAARDRRAAPAPGRRHPAGRARDRLRPRPDPARALGHGPVRLPAGGGADAAYTHACMTRAYHAARGELEQRDEVITTIQAHPCNAATAAAAGFKVITLPLEENGYPSLDALRGGGLRPHRGADGHQPRRHGHLQPRHRASGSTSSTTPAASASTTTPTSTGSWARCAPRELGFDACMFMLHKTFGAPEGRRRAGRRRLRVHATSWRRSCPGPIVAPRRRPLPARADGRASIGKVREFLGQRPAGREGLRVGAGDGRRGHPRGVRPLGARQQLHGAAAARDPRASRKSHPDVTSAAAGDDALQPRDADRGDRGDRASTCRTGWSTSGSTRSGSATSRGSCPSRSRPRPASCGRRRTSTTGSTCSPTSCDEAYNDPETVTVGTAQPADPQARLHGRQRPRSLGHHVAGLRPEARGQHGRGHLTRGLARCDHRRRHDRHRLGDRAQPRRTRRRAARSRRAAARPRDARRRREARRPRVVRPARRAAGHDPRARCRRARSRRSASRAPATCRSARRRPLELKRQLLGELDALTPPETILASSSSAITASAMASELPGRARCLVVHPGNPPYLLPVVEVVPAPFTAADVVERTHALLERRRTLPGAGARRARGLRVQPAAGRDAARGLRARARRSRVGRMTSIGSSATAWAGAGA